MSARSTLKLNPLQSEFIRLRAGGRTPGAAVHYMAAWREIALLNLQRVPGIWPRAIVREIGRLGAELATLGAVARMTRIVEVMR